MRPPAALLRPPSQSAREPFAACSRIARGPPWPARGLVVASSRRPRVSAASKASPLASGCRRAILSWPRRGALAPPARFPCGPSRPRRGPVRSPLRFPRRPLSAHPRLVRASVAAPLQPVSGPVAARSRPSRGPVVSRASSARGFPTAASRPSRGAPGSLVATPRGAFEGPLGAIRRSRAPWRCASLGRVARDWRPLANASSPPSSSPEDRVPLVRPWFC